MIMATHLFPSPFYTALLELFAIRLMILYKRKPISFTESLLDACIANMIYHTEKMEQVIVRVILSLRIPEYNRFGDIEWVILGLNLGR